jgi:hypothetical protein
MKYRVFLTGLLGLGCACGQPGNELDRARKAAAGLGQEIRQLLMEELKKGGFEGAVAACASSAQTATRAFARRERIDIRRISARWRNSKNAPDPYEQTSLATLEKLNATGKLPEEVYQTVAGNGRSVFRYLKPITIAPMCLSCHGAPDQISEGVRAELGRRFPGDHATGYRAGELRGAFSVRITLP